MWQKSYDGSPTLYLVPTPIGNMEDITIRAINVLKEVKVIFSEDTRVTSLLLKRYDIKSKLICLEDHNEESVKNKVLSFLESGSDVAIVSDRGTPLISDPGYKTVKYVVEKGYNVVSLPGATAFVPALTMSALPPLPFLLYGFLNSRESKRIKELESLREFGYSIVFYESPHRIKKVLEEMFDIFGNRDISISREISKKFESVYRGNLCDVVNSIDNIKGEFVIVISGNNDISNDCDIDYNDLISKKIEEGYSVMDSIKLIASRYGVSKNILYKKYHGGNK